MAENKKLEVKDLKISFKTDNGIVQAVRDISFDLYEGETLCIVGESGSGKSVTSKAIMGILANNAVVESGSIMYEGENLLDVSEEEFHKIRGRKIGMIFQDPLSSLNPIMRIGKQITEATLVNANKIKQKYEELISKENLAYKNAIAHTKIVINKEKEKYLKAELEAKKKLAETKDASEKKQIQEELATKKADYKAFAKNEKTALKEKLPALKEALNERKKTASVEISEYKAQIQAEYEAKAKPITEAMQTALNNRDKQTAKLKADFEAKQDNSEKAVTEYKSKLNAIKTEYAELMKQYNSDLALAKQEYVDKTKVTKAEAKRRALEIMKEVGIPFPEKRFRQYPFEFSGGMRQRIVIAIALTANPDVLICDEPTTALDVTIQAQILELINKLKVERNLSCIFITHDLGVVANMADRVAVMYAGKIVEFGTANEIFFEPKHPYTWALLSSIPDVDSKERLEAIPGTPPDMIYPPKGDAFALRSKYAMEIDYKYQPPFFKVSDTHYAATWLLHPDAPKVEMPKIVSERIKIALGGKNEPAEQKEEVAPESPAKSKKTTKAAPRKKTTKKSTTTSEKTKTPKKTSTKKVKEDSADE